MPSSGGTTGVALSWLSPRQVKVGDTITLQIMAKSDTPVADLPLTLIYDPAVLQHVAASEGDFMRQGGSPSQFVNRPGPVGQVAVGAGKPGGVGASGSGVLVSFNFVVLTTASTPTSLSLVNASAAAPGGASIPVQAPLPLQITIAPPP